MQNSTLLKSKIMGEWREDSKYKEKSNQMKMKNKEWYERGDIKQDMTIGMKDGVERWIGKIQVLGASKPSGKKLLAGIVEMKST